MEKEKSAYKKKLENDIFYNFSAPFILFSDYASRKVCEEFGMTHRELRVLSGAKLFMNVRQFARPRQLQKVMEYDKFFMSKTLKSMVEKNLLVRVDPEVVRKRNGLNKANGLNHYFKIGIVGLRVIKAFNEEIIRLIRQFDEDRHAGEYNNIKLDEKGKVI